MNEPGIYEALFASRKLEARKFRIWTSTVLKKLRKSVGLEGYTAERLHADMILRSVTVQGADVEQIPFYGEL